MRVYMYRGCLDGSGVPGESCVGGGSGLSGPDVHLSDTVFKNVQVLKGIPADEFMDTMGMFAASLGYDCASCHSPDIKSDRAAFAVTTPQIRRARQMITLWSTASTRPTSAGGPWLRASRATRAITRPRPSRAWRCSTARSSTIPIRSGLRPMHASTTKQVFDKYLQALGGAQRVSALTSFVAHGTVLGLQHQRKRGPARDRREGTEPAG